MKLNPLVTEKEQLEKIENSMDANKERF